MKIAVHTISDDNNFGNRLQNFALVKALSNGKTNEVVTLQDNNINHKNYYSRFNDFHLTHVYLLLTTIKAKLNGSSNQEIRKYYKTKRRERVFRNFTKFYAPKYKKNKYQDDDFDLYVIGSDQIWNPNFRSNLKNDFLPSISGKKVISFAASIGIEDISKQDEVIISKGIEHLSAVSVREYSAKDILNKLVNCPVDVHIDPTMLIDPAEWHLLAEKANQKIKINHLFVLTYFLGEITEQENIYIHSYADEIKATIIDINMIDNNFFSQIGPLEFLWLFEHAHTIFADSYHAAVFSIIFKKNFEVFERHDSFRKMNTRMETLFAHFNIENRIHNLDIDSKTLPAIDYCKIDPILNTKKAEAKEWLNRYTSQ